MPSEKKTDVLIIGAGLLGCFAARELTAYALSVTVLEAREDAATGLTKANTAIVYTGCDNKPGTLKTELCVRANAGFEALCAELSVPFPRCGSLMVAFGEKGERVLQKKLKQGQENGVPGLRLLSREETLTMEPSLSRELVSALYAPGTGTVNPWALCLAACENAAANGADFHFCSEVTEIRREGREFLVRTGNALYRAGAVVNCGGLRADALREMTETPLVRIFPTGADYLVTDKAPSGGVTHIIFHEPEVGKKGLTVVPTVDGNLLLGPTEREAESSLTAFATESFSDLWELCGRVLPGLEPASVIRSFAGARPNPAYVEKRDGVWEENGHSIHDFCILEEDGLFSLIGIKTPGLTCAHELARLLSPKIADYLHCRQKNPVWSPYRKAIPQVSRMSYEARSALLAKDPRCGRIVCQCGEITEGEIVEAIRRGARSIDGVKRRVGSGMGRCQGSRCRLRIAEILARELRCSVEEITRDGSGTFYLKGGEVHEN